MSGKVSVAALRRMIEQAEREEREETASTTPTLSPAELECRVREVLGDEEYERGMIKHKEFRENLRKPEFWDALPSWEIAWYRRIGIPDPREAAK